MAVQVRPFLICLVAYVVSLGLTLLALSAMLDLTSVGFETQVPSSAVLVPMIAVVAFWGISRALGVPLDPAKTFLFGAIAVYALLFFMGRIVALTQINSNLATVVAALILFVAAYVWVSQAKDKDVDLL